MLYHVVLVKFDEEGCMYNADTNDKFLPHLRINAIGPGKAFVQVGGSIGHFWPKKVVVVKDDREI